MILPNDYKTLTDEQLLAELTSTYDAESAAYLLEVIRGRAKAPGPLV